MDASHGVGRNAGGQLRSFDVFDTLITRLWALPQDLFIALGEQARQGGWVTLEAGEFARQRADAESAARRSVPGAEVNLEEIYAELGRRHAWPPPTLQRLMSKELELELDCSRPIPSGVRKLTQAREAGHHVAFLSDTYLPQPFVQQLLRQAGVWREGDLLWVSQAHRCSKASSKLFIHVREQLEVRSGWIHAGDNAHSDVSVPRGLGIAAQELADGRLNRFETLARRAGATTGAKVFGPSTLAGAMRAARLHNTLADDRHNTIWDVSTGVVGPLLFGFVQWCLQSARKRGLTRLYFVARDGQIMQRIAQRIAQRWSYDIECRYLMGSRQAWHPAGMTHLGEEELAWILPPTKFLSVQQAFERLGLDLADHADALKAHGLALDDASSNLDAAERQRLRECLLERSVARAAEARSADRRRILLLYLQQEGLLQDDAFAIVDIGWSGNLQNSLARVLKLSGRGSSELTGFYFGLLGQGHSTRSITALPGQTKLDYWTTFAAPNDPLWRQNLALFECFTAADHGSVMGFTHAAGHATPLLVSEKNERALQWGLSTLQQGALAFTDCWLENAHSTAMGQPEFFQATRAVLDEFYEHPTAAEARVWGAFSYSDGQTEAAFEQFVPVWRPSQTLAALLDPLKRPSYWWPQGTNALYPSLPLTGFLALKKLNGRLKRQGLQ